MYKIFFSSNWGEEGKVLLNRMSWMTENNSGIWNNKIQGTNNLEEADYIIVLNGLNNNLRNYLNKNPLKKDKVIFLPREPIGVGTARNDYSKNEFKYGYTYKDIYHSVTQSQFMRLTYDQFVNIDYHEKPKLLSSVTSMKMHTKGSRKRVEFLRNICKKYPEKIDVYGGWWDNSLGSCYKGELTWFRSKHDTNENTKYVGHKDYKYSLCFENTSTDNYFSEKFTDCILSWTIPIYWGCKNIDKYFPKDCYHNIDIFDENSYEKVIEIINKPITQKNIDALKEARKLILNKYNIWSTIENIIVNDN